MTSANLELVYVSQGPLCAEVARTKLEANGITVFVRYSAVGRALGLTFDGLGQVQVWVRPADAEAARAVLEELDLPDGVDATGADEAPDGPCPSACTDDDPAPPERDRPIAR